MTLWTDSGPEDERLLWSERVWEPDDRDGYMAIEPDRRLEWNIPVEELDGEQVRGELFVMTGSQQITRRVKVDLGR